jgi:hypothetical protein
LHFTVEWAQPNTRASVFGFSGLRRMMVLQNLHEKAATHPIVCIVLHTAYDLVFR